MLLFLIFFTFATACSSTPITEKDSFTFREKVLLSQLHPLSQDPIEHAYQKLLQAGITPEYAKKIRDAYLAVHDEQGLIRERIISLNVFGFLSHSDYSAHYNNFAIKKTKSFLKHYRKTLNAAEKKFAVNKEVIAALLWVETKHGKQTGNFALPFVYFSLAQADHPTLALKNLEILNSRKAEALKNFPSLTEESMEQKTIDRSSKKATWAVDQLKVIENLSHSNLPTILSLKSSFAGAFGFPQFIPKAFQDFAVSATHQPDPNLFNMKDAIYSVGNYLQHKGWKKNDHESQTTALYEYNHSQAYGEVILKIADEIKN
jgi:membrane-bound lytic murein transglycosylase B